MSTVLRRSFTPWLILPAAALLAITPLLRHGVSCGHDLGFHMMSWLDAAQQMRHGTPYPRWAVTPAWHAGEPRFVFYPPLSWMLGALLTMVLRADTAAVVFVWLAFAGAGLAMYRLAREFVQARVAMIAAVLYIVNPYMMFNAFERSALAELLSSAWMPLLLLGLLRARPTLRGIGLPLALLWLTNAPAGVMGSYLFALVAVVRVAQHALQGRRAGMGAGETMRFALTFVAGAVSGLALPAFYLLPAAWERRYVQVSMAIIPGMRFQDNFLFRHTADGPHDAVNHTASVIALSVLAAAMLLLTVCLLPRTRREPNTPRDTVSSANTLGMLAIITVVITALLVPLSTPLWKLLPNFAYLQFPWRLVTILAVVAALTLALALERLEIDTNRLLVALPLLLFALASFEYSQTVQVCEATDGPMWLTGVVASGHGVPPTDEYTPNDADNDVLRTANPAYWLADDPNASAPGTHPNPAQLDPTFSDTIPLADTLSAAVPSHFLLRAAKPSYLILNLRDYPNWDISESDPNSMERYQPPHKQRDDGLIAVPLYYASTYDMEIHWHRSADQKLGLAISVLALLFLVPWVGRKKASPALLT